MFVIVINGKNLCIHTEWGTTWNKEKSWELQENQGMLKKSQGNLMRCRGKPPTNDQKILQENKKTDDNIAVIHRIGEICTSRMANNQKTPKMNVS